MSTSVCLACGEWALKEYVDKDSEYVRYVCDRCDMVYRRKKSGKSSSVVTAAQPKEKKQSAPSKQQQPVAEEPRAKTKGLRASSGFNFFQKECHAEAKSAGDTRSMNEINKEISVLWKGMTDEQKQPYWDMSSQDKMEKQAMRNQMKSGVMPNGAPKKPSWKKSKPIAHNDHFSVSFVDQEIQG